MKIVWITLGILVVAFFVIRSRYRTEVSALLTEPGHIEQLTWIPATSGSGVGSSGSNVVVVSTRTAEQFAVVISCPHGKFSLRPTGATAKNVFNGFKAGDSITIHYREVYRVHRDGVRELYKLDFLRAEHR